MVWLKHKVAVYYRYPWDTISDRVAYPDTLDFSTEGWLGMWFNDGHGERIPNCHVMRIHEVFEEKK